MSEKGYRVVCFSLYDEDLAQLDAKVEQLRPRLARANKSMLVRIALARLDVSTITAAEVSPFKHSSTPEVGVVVKSDPRPLLPEFKP